jgi:hypothetical protein
MLWFLSASFGELLFAYVCITSKRKGDSIPLHFHSQVLDILVTETFPLRETVTNTLLAHGLQPRTIQHARLRFTRVAVRLPPSLP